MNISDLEYIFKPQVEEGTGNLYFILIESTHKLIQRHAADKLEELLQLLSHFQYAGLSSNQIPQFTK
jgi:hypothetical protein